jgi:ABC-2 type transport system ATP-binding protein
MGSGTGVIVCEGLTKRYGATLAVDRLDLDVAPGQVYGFLGPNGAGKTTTIRMLVGLVAPSAGRAIVNGRAVPDPSIPGSFGSMIEDPRFYPWMAGRANLEVLAATGARIGRGLIDEAIGRAGLSGVAGRKVKTYSQGMRQRLGLAAALLRRPGLLILDEPTNGLDPEGIHDVRGLMRRLAADGGTVFVSSHLLAGVELVADRAAVLVRSRLVEEGPVSELGASGRTVRVVVDPGDQPAALAALAQWAVRAEGPALVVQHGVGRDVNAMLVAVGVVAERIEVVQPGLEERYLELMGGEQAVAAPRG